MARYDDQQHFLRRTWIVIETELCQTVSEAQAPSAIFAILRQKLTASRIMGPGRCYAVCRTVHLSLQSPYTSKQLAPATQIKNCCRENRERQSRKTPKM